MKALMMLDTVNEDADDVELAYWAVVEDATHVDEDDSAVTSPYWVTVEEIMSCKRYSRNIFAAIKLCAARSGHLTAAFQTVAEDFV